ncbi:Histidine kinase-, DNA gyrase B-, and HSP90-like ATPase [Carpediemonas membranifera]|uniref:histidine kinase n=1 Tax=Carpediemonas membranifera TaxID=201153 RepID=A0A8J6AZV1_9EUKA|nr:Histidine kinase-, DNA gyrase B-, and HSP90-like ATPase [Carpediemonas membranifera]|eukprot:KAG9391234.1 Histidine kinase-, DNA gyrase B-, and HSP90-like ATPase [Carpediemonas membranifera]
MPPSRSDIIAELEDTEREIRKLEGQLRHTTKDLDLLHSTLHQTPQLVYCELTPSLAILDSNEAFDHDYSSPRHLTSLLDNAWTSLDSEGETGTLEDELDVDGEPHSIEWTITRVLESGRLSRAILTGVDAMRTTTMAAADCLNDIQLFKMLDTFSAGAFWCAEIDGRFPNGARVVYCSKRIEDFYEIPAERICDDTAATWLEPVVPEHKEPTRRAFFDFISGHGEYDVTYRMKGPRSGTVRWVHAVGVRLDADGHRAAFGTVEDVTARVKASQLNAHLQFILDTIRDSLPDIIIMSDVRGFDSTGLTRPIFVTKSFETITGVPMNRVELNKDDDLNHVVDCFHPDEAAWALRRLKAFLAGKGPFCLQHRFVNIRTGEVSHMLTRASVVRDDAGRPVSTVIVSFNRTTEVQVQEVMRRTKFLFERMSDTIDDVFFIADPPNRVIQSHECAAETPSFEFVSTAALTLFGIAAEELCYDPRLWLAAVVREDRARVIEAITSFCNDALLDPTRAKAELTCFIEVDGVEKCILHKVRATVNRRGQPLKFIGSWTDISQLTRNEATLSLMKRQFDMISDNIETVYYMISTQVGCTTFKVLYANKFYETLTGRSREALYQRGSEEWDELVHPDDLVGVQESFYRAMQSAPWSFTYRIVAYGKVRHIINRRMSLTRSGNEVKAVGFIVDITDLVESQQRKNEAQAQMNRAQRLESLGVLAGGVAHEFGNMTAVVMGNADMALDLIGPDDVTAPLFQSIIDTCLKSSAFTSKLLAYSGKGLLQVVDINLTTLVLGMMDFIQASLPAGVKVNWKLSRERTLPCVKGDPSQLRQVVSIIVANGVEAIGTKPGHLTISTGHCQCKGRPCVYLSVADTGVGMDEGVRSHLFDPFVRKEGGKGLSLAAAHGIVSSHGGTVSVRSSLGEGAVFTVRLPCTSETHTTDLENGAGMMVA